MLKRGSGILLHITSLPYGHGIGDLGSGAIKFIEFLHAAGQQYWQFLPLGPTDSTFGHSPYMSLSAYAGNPLLISLELLQDQGLLAGNDFDDLPAFSEYLVEWEGVVYHKKLLLQRAFNRFLESGEPENFKLFCRQHDWLEDYALFMAIRDSQTLRSWHDWPDELARRDPKALEMVKEELEEQINYYKFEQYCFYSQWEDLRAHAARYQVKLVGDIPIYVSADSADVWANPDCFLLDPQSLQPTHVAGVPPDYFSRTGQRWGNPLYRWKIDGRSANKALYQWWRQRFSHLREWVDVVRIDHFRGFESYWEIPASEETAINGRWRKGPGLPFFKAMDKAIADLEIIAEDLGIITPAVEKLRDDLGLPGMKILQFAFDSDENNTYLPFNYTTTNCIVYSGTHDNDTTLGWFMGDDAPPESKQRALKYANSHDGSQISWDFLRMAYASIAKVAIVPLQDALGFGADCRMNTPSTSEGNWRWRVASRFLDVDLQNRLFEETKFYGRETRVNDEV